MIKIFLVISIKRQSKHGELFFIATFPRMSMILNETGSKIMYF